VISAFVSDTLSAHLQSMYNVFNFVCEDFTLMEHFILHDVKIHTDWAAKSSMAGLDAHVFTHTHTALHNNRVNTIRSLMFAGNSGLGGLLNRAKWCECQCQKYTRCSHTRK